MDIQKYLEMLGYKVEDKVTGFAGIAESISFDLYGCIQIVVKPPVKKDGDNIEGRWYDIERLTITSTKRVMPLPSFEGYVKKERKTSGKTKGPADKPSSSRQLLR